MLFRFQENITWRNEGVSLFLGLTVVVRQAEADPPKVNAD